MAGRPYVATPAQIAAFRATAIGVPPGGTAGHVLTKSSGPDFHTQWAAGGGGGGASQLDGGNASSTYGGVTAIDGGGA